MEESKASVHNKEEYPSMHTAEHLIGGAVVRMLGCGRAFTTHIERKKSKCDFRCERGLTPDELERIERTVNEHVSNTSEIPSVAIVSSDWADGVLRIRFKLAK